MTSRGFAKTDSVVILRHIRNSFQSNPDALLISLLKCKSEDKRGRECFSRLPPLGGALPLHACALGNSGGVRPLRFLSASPATPTPFLTFPANFIHTAPPDSAHSLHAEPDTRRRSAVTAETQRPAESNNNNNSGSAASPRRSSPRVFCCLFLNSFFWNEVDLIHGATFPFMTQTHKETTIGYETVCSSPDAR